MKNRKRPLFFRLIIQYDGTEYFGWQRQPHTERTIQHFVEQALGKVAQERVLVFAAGRTDAGVHALRQVAHCATGCALAPAKLRLALNALLPDDIRVISVARVGADFHSRYRARSKTYRYTILNRTYHDAFMHRFVHQVPQPLDVKAMQRAARLLVGRHDFSSFKIFNPRRTHNIRLITALTVVKRGAYITLTITGSGFLHKMVRGIVGTLIEVGRHKITVEDFARIIRLKNRKAAGPTAPACGLCLLKVRY